MLTFLFQVELWPQHFLVTQSLKGEALISYKHFGDRNHDAMEKEIVKALWRGRTDEPPTVNPLNHEPFLDAEIFFGKDHRKKNNSEKKHGCGDGACRIQKGVASNALVPDPEKR